MYGKTMADWLLGLLLNKKQKYSNPFSPVRVCRRLKIMWTVMMIDCFSKIKLIKETQRFFVLHSRCNDRHSWTSLFIFSYKIIALWIWSELYERRCQSVILNNLPCYHEHRSPVDTFIWPKSVAKRFCAFFFLFSFFCFHNFLINCWTLENNRRKFKCHFKHTGVPINVRFVWRMRMQTMVRWNQ